MVQERRGMLKVWNLFLVIASFALSIFGTFLVRSGIINSVHSFSFFFNDTATTEIYTLSLHDALPISDRSAILGTTPHSLAELERQSRKKKAAKHAKKH